ncbi:hypothetical protein EJ06DRAFT_534097 [Trichodelitschia bisporula]|uniref:Uncharacterized protein n=1 Tax=Trichodelitschia bisporula TaxID=703511 RepID=A0A6G1HKI9_9PEZI|nr:hypothetical protein EJ06DRAFT_534097 [Trichodelitschia bisporula]
MNGKLDAIAACHEYIHIPTQGIISSHSSASVPTKCITHRNCPPSDMPDGAYQHHPQ